MTDNLIVVTINVLLQGLDAERDVLRESQRLASERDRELEALRQQVRYSHQSSHVENYSIILVRFSPGEYTLGTLIFTLISSK